MPVDKAARKRRNANSDCTRSARWLIDSGRVTSPDVSYGLEVQADLYFWSFGGGGHVKPQN